MSTCKIQRILSTIECTEEALEDDPEGLCILHSREPHKDAACSFSTAIQAKLDRKDYDFRGVFFPCPVAFQGKDFKKDADFSRATFSGEAIFSKATFSGGANFYGATFSGGAGFLEATFSGEASFSRATFSHKADFFRATFSGDAVFWRATFSGRANFCEAGFSGQAVFLEATFSWEAYFSEATFAEKARFSEATFSGDVWFSKATFSGEASFSEANFSAMANFYRAAFSAGADFFMAAFSDSAVFSQATFSDESRFLGIRIQREGKLRFQELSLAHVRLEGTDLRRLEFHNVIWNRSWWRDAVYDEVILYKKEMVRLSQVIKESAYLADVVRWNTEKDKEPEEIDPREYARVEELYRYLKINYEREGDHKKAGDFHYGEMEMHRRGSPWRGCPVYWYNLYRVLSGYGERPVRAFIWLLLLLPAWAGLVWWFGVSQAGSQSPLSYANTFLFVLEKALLQRPAWPEGINSLGKILGSLSVLLLPGQAALFILALRNRLGRMR